MISCESECILFIILKEGSSVRLRALGAPANYVSLHGMQKERKGTFGACLARENRGRVSGREKAKSSPLEIETFLPFPFLSYIPLSTPAKQV